MTTEKSLGGRLPLLADAALSPDQRELRDALLRTRGERARRAGYRAATDDGRLIGPFNAFLVDPAIGAAHLGWVEAIGASGLTPTVTESVILTIAGLWDSPYVRYAHSAAAHTAGIAETDVALLLAGRDPIELGQDAAVAARLTRSLLLEHRVTDDLYATARAAFGDRHLVALVELAGQYLTTCALLACFDVPAPAPAPAPAPSSHNRPAFAQPARIRPQSRT